MKNFHKFEQHRIKMALLGKISFLIPQNLVKKKKDTCRLLLYQNGTLFLGEYIIFKSYFTYRKDRRYIYEINMHCSRDGLSCTLGFLNMVLPLDINTKTR